MDRMKDLPLHFTDRLSGLPFVPVPVEMLGHGAELDYEVAAEVFGLDFASLFPPQPQ